LFFVISIKKKNFRYFLFPSQLGISIKIEREKKEQEKHKILTNSNNTSIESESGKRLIQQFELNNFQYIYIMKVNAI